MLLFTGYLQKKNNSKRESAWSHYQRKYSSTIKQKPLIIYKPRKKPMIISLGDRDGILIYPPFIIPGFIPAILKLLVEKIGIKRLH
jgi:hypothetical protein